MHKPITIVTNDPNNKAVVVYLKAEVKIQLGFDPLSLNLGRREFGKVEVTEYIRVIGEIFQKHTITRVISRNSYIKVDLVRPDRENHEYRLAVTLLKTAPIGNLYGSIEVWTDDPAHSKTLVHVQAQIIAAVP